MIINQGNLSILFTGYKAAFQSGLGMAQPTWERIATSVPLTTGTKKYAAWPDAEHPRVDWRPRCADNIAASYYAIKNKDFEAHGRC